METYRVVSITDRKGNPRIEGRYPLRVGRMCKKPTPRNGDAMMIEWLAQPDGTPYVGMIVTSTVIGFKTEDRGKYIEVTTKNSIYTFGRLIRNGILCNMAYGDKYDISSMFTDTDGNQVRFKRHQIVMQTFFMGDRRRYDTVDHINNVERFDNSIYNLRLADKGVQCGNRKDKPGKHRMVICIGDEEEIFFSCREAERLYNLPPNSVGKVCRGELESIYGYRFGYL